MMKLKKLQVLRPEIEVEYQRPILGRLLTFFFVMKTAVRVRRVIFKIEIPSKLLKNAGTVYNCKVWYLIIPKIKAVKAA